MPKLTTGSSLRGTMITSRPFLSVKRWMGGRASSAGLGGSGERIKSLRPAQYSRGGLDLAGADLLSACAWGEAGVAGGLVGDGDDAQLPARSRAVSVSDERFISWHRGRRVGRG